MTGVRAQSDAAIKDGYAAQPFLFEVPAKGRSRGVACYVAVSTCQSQTPPTMRKRPQTSAIEAPSLSTASRSFRRCIEKSSISFTITKNQSRVAQIVGAPASTVKTRMFYARKRMENLLKATGLDAF